MNNDSVLSISSMASMMLFGTIIFCTSAMLAQSVIYGGDLRTIQYIVSNSTNSKSTALDITSFMSIYIFLFNVSILGLIMLYAYLCEHHPPYPHGEKSYDRDQFFFLTAILIVVSLYTLKKNDNKSIISSTGSDSNNTSNHDNKDVTMSTSSFWRSTMLSIQQERPIAPVNEHNEILNRDQTEEWKGWMQYMFLLYHYMKAEEVYNVIRIMITCYVWMTGFGNFSFFYIKDDYSIIRILQMIWRLNFLVCILCFTQGTTYILYYICLLHTYYFMMVYITMRIAKQINYTKYGIRIKLLILGIIIFFIWDVDTGIFQLIHHPFLSSGPPILGATSGSMWEWYFRSSLDHWSTFLGMVFALNFPITSYFFRALEAQPLLYHALAKFMMGAILLVASCAWVMGPFQLNKFDYNQTNAYFGIVPVLTYIYFRNLTPWLRSHTLDLLHQIGKTTLETYLMQHHIWLTSNAKSLLILIPGWPMINFLLVTFIYVYISRRLYTMTLFLRGMILPNNLTACLKNLFGIALFVGLYISLAYILRYFGILTYVSAGVCSIILGTVFFKVIIFHTWSTFAETTNQDYQTNSLRCSSSLYAGALTITFIGIICHFIIKTGGGAIQPLQENCEYAVQQVKWIEIDGCNELTRGASYRENDITSLGTCSVSTWGWDATPSSDKCRFTHRDPKSLQKALQHRNITFVGDSIVRHLYFAWCRQLGDIKAGAYNTSMEKWSDFSQQFGKGTSIEFRWAPYISNLTDIVDRLELGIKKPDLLVLGGGAWDRLHMYSTESEQDTLQLAVTSLAQKLQQLKTNIPITWVVPTTINSWGLTSDEKKDNIREDQMKEFRDLYRESGITDSVSFALDGTTFTSDVVTESYDGVHYPLSVYDAGAQILANAIDWLLLTQTAEEPFVAPQPGSMDNPILGFAMLIFIIVGLFAFDGFMGVSYITTLILPKLAPHRLYNITFRALHIRAGLPAISINSTTNGTEMTPPSQHHHLSDNEESETETFLNKG